MNSTVLFVVILLVLGPLAVWVARPSGQVRGLQQTVDRLVSDPSAGNRGPAPTVAPPTPLEAAGAQRAGLSADGEHLVRQALQDGDRIEAVKYVREETGMGLREAHQYVKTLERRADDR